MSTLLGVILRWRVSADSNASRTSVGIAHFDYVLSGNPGSSFNVFGGFTGNLSASRGGVPPAGM